MTQKNDILFINRDENFLKDMQEALLQSGYSVIAASDMRGALSVITSNAVGLIVCDNNLKDISGYDFLRFLKSDPLREKIPFVFLVPISDQGRAIKAFKLGAADFIVYPMETEEVVLRIKEVFPVSGTGRRDPTHQDQKTESSDLQPEDLEPIVNERRKGKRAHILPALHVEVSRNGILWIPGRIKNLNVRGMFLETPLLGKPGVELYVRVSLPTGTSVVKGQVKHIAFKNFNPSAGIGIEVEKGPQWKEILQYLASLIQNGNPNLSTSTTSKPLTSSQNIKETIILTGAEDHAPESLPPKSNAESYDIRFYHSLIGKQLNNYKAVSFIGAGGMGGVFKGWDIALERAVALKVISYKLSAHETFREMFIKEARLISKLEHPNIAHVYYIGDINQILYFAMEFIDGPTLADLIKNGDNLNTLKGLNYLITICEALDFVSQNNIIHRDIKPANIMINNQDIVKIVDFGVAKAVSAKTKENIHDGIVGSPFYISPDSIEGLPLDRRSDIYSLGASFYHAFTGQRPFEGQNVEEVLSKHLNEELVPLKKKNPKVSNALGKIVEKMMAKLPEERYQDYKGIIKDLKSLQSKALKFQKLKNATLIFRIKGKNKILKGQNPDVT